MENSIVLLEQFINSYSLLTALKLCNFLGCRTNDVCISGFCDDNAQKVCSGGSLGTKLGPDAVMGRCGCKMFSPIFFHFFDVLENRKQFNYS